MNRQRLGEDKALHARCPTCGAAPEEQCRNSKGKGMAPHGKRIKAADPQLEHHRQARLKTERERAKVMQETPLFAEEALAEVRTPEENYWRTRQGIAGSSGTSDPYAGFTEDWQVIVLKELARRVMPPDLFTLACERLPNLGHPVMRWTRLLTDRERYVLRYDRIVYYGPYLTVFPPNQYRAEPHIWLRHEKVELREVETWPPPEWTPPYSADEIKALLATPAPLEAPDDGGLSALVDSVIARAEKRQSPEPDHRPH